MYIQGFYWLPFCMKGLLGWAMMALAEIALDLLLSVIFDLCLIWTGELLLCVFTLGRRKPTFRFWKEQPRSRLPDLLSLNALVGLLFWALICLWGLA
jgi:hypothetical protein